MAKTLLLWDIDGTLISSGNAGMHALGTALHRVFGISGSLEDIEFAGRTDRWITRRVFEKFGLPPTEENFTRYLDAYIAELPAKLANPAARVLPGVRELLQHAAGRANLSQGLLTGNIRRGAEVKLGYHGLWTYFPFGAFADDSEQRDDLGAHAMRRAREHAGLEFSPGDVWVIGDTPHDIACGRVIGARTLAVTTGHFTAEQLRAHQPTALLPDLSDAEAFFRLLEK